LFAVARELAGAEVVEVAVPQPCTVAQLRDALAAAVPTLADVLPHVLFAADSQYLRNEAVLPGGGEVACIPPVSGG
jgi:molybdopterin converting factor small subunit